MKKIIIGAAVLIAAIAFAAAQSVGSVSKNNDPKPQQFVNGIFIGEDGKALANTLSKETRSLGASATIDFSSAQAGTALSSSITVTGAKAGDPCFVGVPTAAAALKAVFSCYVDAADSVKVSFAPADTAAGAMFIDGGTNSVTVSSGSLCLCNDSSDETKGCKAPVSSTTATFTGTGGDIVNYFCSAPVDPASGTFYVRVISSQ